MNFGHRHILFLTPTFQPHQTQALLPILLSHFDNAYAAITNILRPGAAVVQSPQPNIIYARPEGQISNCNPKLYTSLGDRLFSIQAAHTNPQVVPWNHFFAQHQINARGVHMRQFGYLYLPQQNPNIPGSLPFAPNHIFNEADGQRSCVPPCLCSHTCHKVPASANSRSSCRPRKWP